MRTDTSMERDLFQNLDTYCGHEPCDGGRHSVSAEDWVGGRVQQVPTERNPPGRLRFMGRAKGVGGKRDPVAGIFLRWIGVWMAVVVVAGCGPRRPEVVVYAAQDRVFAEPILAEFERTEGVKVRALYDSEATKTVGLANRLIAESARPQADVWWSNEEMRTRQLAERGILERGWKTFGARQRVFVVRTNAEVAWGGEPRLAALTNAALRGRVAIAYPVFGATTTHFLALRQRWGEAAWQEWCRALAANRPLVVDGNSVVVRLVGRGDAVVGLTDSDDVAFGKREGLPVKAVPLPAGEGLELPNAAALVAGTERRDVALRLTEFLSGPWVYGRLAAEGAIAVEGVPAGHASALTEEQWSGLLTEFETSLDWMRETFVR